MHVVHKVSSIFKPFKRKPTNNKLILFFSIFFPLFIKFKVRPLRYTLFGNNRMMHAHSCLVAQLVLGRCTPSYLLSQLKNKTRVHEGCSMNIVGMELFLGEESFSRT